jgi:TolB protein
MKRLLTIFQIVIFLSAFSQPKAVGVFTNHDDVGNPKIKGNTVYDPKSKTYNIEGGGYNIWFNRDEFQFAYKKMHGDFILTAHFEFIGSAKEGHRKIGWMVRRSLADSAVHVSAVVHGDGLTVLQWRVKPGMNMRDPDDEIRAPENKNKYSIVQLERKGKKFIMRVAEKEGMPFITVGEHEMENLQGDVLAGIFICSHTPDVLEKAKIWYVKIKN